MYLSEKKIGDFQIIKHFFHNHKKIEYGPDYLFG